MYLHVKKVELKFNELFFLIMKLSLLDNLYGML